jgi:hypothetical protein
MNILEATAFSPGRGHVPGMARPSVPRRHFNRFITGNNRVEVVCSGPIPSPHVEAGTALRGE